MDAIEFPSIHKKETAKYIFEFINFLSHRLINNSITPFSKLDDIKGYLQTQWSHLFQRMLLEARTKAIETRRYQDFSEQLSDLKAVIMASITTPNLRETARGAIQYRHLITLLIGLQFPTDNLTVLISDKSWGDILNEAGIIEITEFVGFTSGGFSGGGNQILLVKKDRTFYKVPYGMRFFKEAEDSWANFVKLSKETRKAIIEALSEDITTRRSVAQVRYFNKPYDEYLASMREKDRPVSLEDFAVDR